MTAFESPIQTARNDLRGSGSGYSPASAASSSSSAALATPSALSRSAWIQIGVLSALTLLVFRYNLVRLYEKTNPISGEANWGHSFCVPILGLYYLYLNREPLLAAKVDPVLPGFYTRRTLLASVLMTFGSLALWAVWRHAVVDGASLFNLTSMVNPMLLGIALWGGLTLLGGWGCGTLIFGLLLSAYGIWPGRNDFLKDVGGVFAIFGLVLMMCGWDVMRTAWFPIVFLICAIPWPGLVYSWVASPLQQLAAQVAVGCMNLLGVDSNRSGTKIFISSGFGQSPHALNVAEACAGLRSLMTFIAVAVSVAFLSARPMWQRLIISISAIPIAILCNVLRVTGTGVLYRYLGADWAEGFTHQFFGMIMLVPAFFMILSVGWVLDHLFVEEYDPTDRVAGKILRRVTPELPPAAEIQHPSAPRRSRRRNDEEGRS